MYNWLKILTLHLKCTSLNAVYLTLGPIPKLAEKFTNIFILNQFRLFCERPSSGSLSEKTLEVHRNQTLGEATERAYKVDMSLWFPHLLSKYL